MNKAFFYLYLYLSIPIPIWLNHLLLKLYQWLNRRNHRTKGRWHWPSWQPLRQPLGNGHIRCRPALCSPAVSRDLLIPRCRCWVWLLLLILLLLLLVTRLRLRLQLVHLNVLLQLLLLLIVLHRLCKLNQRWHGSNSCCCTSNNSSSRLRSGIGWRRRIRWRRGRRPRHRRWLNRLKQKYCHKKKFTFQLMTAAPAQNIL